MATESAEAVAEGPNGPLVFESFYWGLVSALSLNIGSIIGVSCLPSMKVRAILMSFGGGALLFALSIELFGNVLNRSSESKVVVVMMICFAIVGGILFAFLNWALNSLGAGIRKPSTTKLRFSRLRFLLMRRLAMRLWNIPFFAVLSWEELKDLIQYGMYKARFVAGDTIMSDEVGDKGIFFILSGKVSAQILGKASNQEKEVHELGPNQIFGNMTVLTGSYFKCIATAVAPTKVLVLPGHEVARLLDVNDAVKNQVSMLAVQRLQQVAELKDLPEHVLASLSARCALVNHKVDDIVFEGAVGAVTPVLCIVLGSVELSYKDGHRKAKVVHASRLICTHHLKRGKAGRQCCVKALEPTSVLVFNRTDINSMLSQGARISLHTAGTLVSKEEEVEESICIPGQVEDPPPPGPQAGIARLSRANTLSFDVPPSKGFRGLVGFSRAQTICFDLPSARPRASSAGISRANTLSFAGQTAGFCPESSSSSSCPSDQEEERSHSEGGSEAAIEAVDEDSTTRSETHRASGQSRASSKLTQLGWGEKEKESLWEEENKMRLSPTGSHAGFVEEELDMELSLSSIAQKRKAFCKTISTTPEGRTSSKKSWGHLGWDASDDMEPQSSHPSSASNLRRKKLMPIGQVTDNELLEREMTIERSSRRTNTPSRVSLESVDCGDEATARPSLLRRAGNALSVRGSGRPTMTPEGPETPQAAAVMERVQTATPVLETDPVSPQTTLEEGAHSEGSRNRAVMVWLGILIDGVPESLVIGIIINKSATGVEESQIPRRVAAAALPFVLGVFLSNLPESMSSSGSMKAHGMRVRTILLMWFAITVLTAVGSSLGALLFPPNVNASDGAELAVASVEGFAAGAMLTMIAQTMMPEAFEQGGDIVGLSCLAGFLCALSVKLIPLDDSSASGH